MTEPDIYGYAKNIAKVPRSICGPGVREVLSYIKEEIPALNIYSVASGSQIFDWTVPQEWNVREAYLVDPKGQKFASYIECPLHLVQHSEPISLKLSLLELKKHLHVSHALPSAIPYVTSYYKKNWGFCITANDYNRLEQGTYEVFIDADLFDGQLNYGEIFIPGKSEEEILVSTYICHPYMGNNEASGPAVALASAKSLMNSPPQKYGVRFIFIPETIGSLVYVHQNFKRVLDKTVGGFVLSCLGDSGNFSFIPARRKNSYISVLVQRLLSEKFLSHNKYDWLTDRGSDERQFCWPSIDLDIVSISRSKYNEYPEYHTSLDDMNFINQKSLLESYKFILSLIDSVQTNPRYRSTTVGEPKLDKLGLYRTTSLNGTTKQPNDFLNFLSLCDGQTDLNMISETLGLSYGSILSLADTALKHRLIK